MGRKLQQLTDQDRFVNKCLFLSACEVSAFLGNHTHNLLPEAAPKGEAQLLHSTMAIISLKYSLPTAVKYFKACDNHYHLCTVNWLASADTLLENPRPYLLAEPKLPHLNVHVTLAATVSAIHEGTAWLLDAFVSSNKDLSRLSQAKVWICLLTCPWTWWMAV